jgi:hypothetical protein
VKTTLKGKRFQDAKNIKKNLMLELNAVTLEAFAISLQNLLKRFNKRVQVGVDYFELKYGNLVFLFLFSHQSGNFIARLHIYTFLLPTRS